MRKLTDEKHELTYQEEDEKSLDVVQRWVASVLVIVVAGGPAAALAYYSASLAGTEPSTAVGLWVMSGVIGLAAMVGILIIHRRSPVSPLVVIGLIPAAISAFFVFGA